MSTVDLISVADLEFDLKNPRFSEVPNSQRAALLMLATSQGEKLLALVQDIVAHQLSPADAFLVVPSKQGRFTVLEGNRRLLALRVLENPGSVEKAVTQRVGARLRDYRKEYTAIESVQCAVFESRSDATHWIELKHTGENEGAGVVPWGADERSRFLHERGAQKTLALQALGFLERRGELDKETRSKVPVTSLNRLLGTPHVRGKLGLDAEKGVLTRRYSPEAVSRALVRVVEDLATRRTRTADIYSKQHRLDYADGLPGDVLPTMEEKEARPIPLEEDSPEQDLIRERRPQSDRLTIFPTGFKLRISNERANNLYHEMRRLILERHANASAMLVRLFLELTVDHRLEQDRIKVARGTKLATRLASAAKSLENAKVVTKDELKGARRATNTSTTLGIAITDLNQLAHNKDFHPSPGDIRAFVDQVRPFFEAVWNGKTT